MYQIGEQYTVNHGDDKGQTGTIGKTYKSTTTPYETRVLVMLSPRYGVWCQPGNKDWS